MITSSGLFVDPLNLKSEQITISDIANSLAKLCRWGGHTSRFYSVAEHCLIGCDYFLVHQDQAQALHFLVHDACEAYIGDIITPIKSVLQLAFCSEKSISQVEDETMVKIWKAFNMTALDYDQDEIKLIDKKLAEQEAMELTYLIPKSNCRLFDLNKYAKLTWREMANEYVNRFKELSCHVQSNQDRSNRADTISEDSCRPGETL